MGWERRACKSFTYPIILPNLEDGAWTHFFPATPVHVEGHTEWLDCLIQRSGGRTFSTPSWARMEASMLPQVAEAPNSSKTKMINGVLLLVFPCPNAQTCTNPWYMTHSNLQTKYRTPECHWLPAAGFQRVQNLDPKKLHNASKSCSRQKTTSTKSMVSRNLTTRRWERKLTKMNWMDGSMMDEL